MFSTKRFHIKHIIGFACLLVFNFSEYRSETIGLDSRTPYDETERNVLHPDGSKRQGALILAIKGLFEVNAMSLEFTLFGKCSSGLERLIY